MIKVTNVTEKMDKVFYRDKKKIKIISGSRNSF